MMRKLLIGLTLLALPLVVATPAEAGWEEGVAAFKGGNFAQAAKEFQGVTQEKPEWPGGHYMLGQALLKLKRNDEAVSSLRKAYDLDPNQVSYQMALAQAYVGANQYSNASNLLSRIDGSKLTGKNQTAYHEMVAVANSKTGRSGEALQSLQKLASMKPNDGAAQFQYGLALFNAGQTAQAASTISKAVRLEPNDVKMKEVYVKVLIRQARETRGSGKTGIYRNAVAAAKDLAGKSPTYEHYLTLGEVQLGAKDYNGAASAFSSAASKNSSDWLVHYYLGQAYTSLAQYPNAEASLRKALEKANANDQKKVWRQIGFVNEKLKDFNAAKVAYTRAGDTASLTRVEENERIALENKEIDAENAKIREMEAEQKALEEELKALPGGRPPF